MASLKKHSDLGAWLMFVRDTSMSDKAMRIFLLTCTTLEGMTLHGKSRSIDQRLCCSTITGTT